MLARLAGQALTMKDRTHGEALAELLKGDPAYAVDLLNANHGDRNA
jgi:hypothetical protein